MSIDVLLVMNKTHIDGISRQTIQVNRSFFFRGSAFKSCALEIKFYLENDCFEREIERRVFEKNREVLKMW